jgi:transposase-like protein
MPRKIYSPREKVKHVVSSYHVSNIARYCREQDIHRNNVYRWRSEFENIFFSAAQKTKNGKISQLKNIPKSRTRKINTLRKQSRCRLNRE